VPVSAVISIATSTDPIIAFTAHVLHRAAVLIDSTVFISQSEKNAADYVLETLRDRSLPHEYIVCRLTLRIVLLAIETDGVQTT
jgi:hypothetical protein